MVLGAIPSCQYAEFRIDEPMANSVGCRTFDHSTMGVATGKKIHHTHFEVPPGVPVGHYDLVVVANGIHSRPVKVRVTT